MADQKFTADDFSKWIPASEVHQKAVQKYGTYATTTILSRLTARLMTARAAEFFLGTEDSLSHGNTLIPPSVWRALADWDEPRRASIWTTNDQELEVPSDGGPLRPSTYVRLFGIRFDPAGVNDLLQTEAVSAPATVPPSERSQVEPKRTGGPTPKEWWDDLWIAMFRAIHFGELRPQKQADVENAMHDWLAERGYVASERTIRNAARKLFKALKEEGQ